MRTVAGNAANQEAGRGTITLPGQLKLWRRYVYLTGEVDVDVALQWVERVWMQSQKFWAFPVWAEQAAPFAPAGVLEAD